MNKNNTATTVAFALALGGAIRRIAAGTEVTINVNWSIIARIALIAFLVIGCTVAIVLEERERRN